MSEEMTASGESAASNEATESEEATDNDEATESDETDDFDVDQLFDLATEIDESVTEFKRAIVEGDGDSNLAELAEDLWEVLDEVGDVLETVDFEEIPDAIDIDELPEAIDAEDVPEGLFDADETAIELTSVREAVNLRELWDAVDLTELYQEKKQLEDEVDDVTDRMDGEEDAEDDGLIGDEEDDGLLEGIVGMGEGAHVEFDAEARQAFIEEKIRDAVVKFREMLLTAHEKLRKLYRMNQEKLGQPGRQPNSLNPTAVSTMPPGPVPDSASLRTSTVPAQVRYSRVDNPRRIYAHRFNEEIGAESDADESDQGEEEEQETEGEADSDEETEETSADEELTIEVYDE